MDTTTDIKPPASHYSPGDVFEHDTMRSTLLALDERVFRTEVEAGPDAGGGPLHRHLHQEERFVVHEGVLRVRSGLRGSRLVGPGEDIVIPAGRPHTFSVAGDGARFTAEFTPPLRLPDYFLELFEIADPGLRALAGLARRYPEEHLYLPVIPPMVQRLALRPFA
jgi:mannose-6-phosphate isomerase-like protein (cupin superfamily)